MYINKSQYGKSAGVLTKAMIDEWYIKYLDVPNANVYTESTFQKIYEEPYYKYQNIVENYSHYWLSTANNSDGVYAVNPVSKGKIYSMLFNAFGIRPVITLSTDAKFESIKAGTKTLTGGYMDTYGGNQTYNVWNIK